MIKRVDVFVGNDFFSTFTKQSEEKLSKGFEDIFKNNKMFFPFKDTEGNQICIRVPYIQGFRFKEFREDDFHEDEKINIFDLF